MGATVKKTLNGRNGQHMTRVTNNLSRVMRKPTFWFQTWSDTNRAVQPQKMARGFGFRKYWDCSIRVAKTKALISFAVTAKLICVFVFAYAKRWFSRDAAQFYISARCLTHGVVCHCPGATYMDIFSKK